MLCTAVFDFWLTMDSTLRSETGHHVGERKFVSCREEIMVTKMSKESKVGPEGGMRTDEYEATYV